MNKFKKLIKYSFQNKSIIFILLFSLFIDLYKIDTLMMFIGDMGRDYLAARDMLLTGNLPMVGIPSSVVWLHQGPLSIYFIGIAFALSNFNPVAPAVFYALFGVATMFLIYKLGKLLFNHQVALLSALFFATSPLIIVNVRMPYHTASIPFFATLLFIFIYKYLKGNKNLIFIISFLFGILLLLELSNAVIAGVIILLYIIYRPKIDKKQIFLALTGFSLGILPFIIYDLSHKFIQTLGLPLWILNRIRVSLGLSFENNPTSNLEISAIYRIYQQLVSAVFPFSKLVAYFVLIITAIIVGLKLKKEHTLGLILIVLWFVIPVISFFIHKAPGTAYFPLIFPPLSLLIGYAIFEISKKYKFVILLFVLGCFLNCYLVIKEEYFLATKIKAHTIPPESYGIGSSFALQEELVDSILADANKKSFMLKGGGFLSTMTTGIDNFIYIAKYQGGNISNKSDLIYTIYSYGDSHVPKDAKIVYKNPYLIVIKNEN